MQALQKSLTLYCFIYKDYIYTLWSIVDEIRQQ